MTEKQFTELTKRAYGMGFRQGYEIANRTDIAESALKKDFVDMVLEKVLNSLESTVFQSLSAELEQMNEKYLAFDSWKVFTDGVIQGAGENFEDRSADQD